MGDLSCSLIRASEIPGACRYVCALEKKKPKTGGVWCLGKHGSRCGFWCGFLVACGNPCIKRLAARIPNQVKCRRGEPADFLLASFGHDGRVLPKHASLPSMDNDEGVSKR